MPPLRIALFALEALPNARPLRRLIAEHAESLVLVGLSNAERPATGGLAGQVGRHLSRSGPGILPYLAVNFGLPDLLRPLAPLTQRAFGAGGAVGATPAATLCERLGIPAFAVDEVNGRQVQQALRMAAPDLILSFHFDQIFAEATLALARHGGINVHPSLLPRHRGPVPTIHAVAEIEPAFGVTVHRLAAAIDAGAILAQEPVSLPPGVTATRAAMLMHDHGYGLLDAILDYTTRAGRLPDGRYTDLLPYCGFPDAMMLRAMRRNGRRLVDAADLGAALALFARK